MKHLYLKDGSINPDLRKRPIIIWGCGNDGHRLCCILKKQEVEILAFCDSNCNLHGKQILDLPVISCGEALKKENVNIALAFHQWINVVDGIKANETCEMFADYLYEETARGGGKVHYLRFAGVYWKSSSFRTISC